MTMMYLAEVEAGMKLMVKLNDGVKFLQAVWMAG